MWPHSKQPPPAIKPLSAGFFGDYYPLTGERESPNFRTDSRLQTCRIVKTKTTVPMTTLPNRIVIYPKDIANITGMRRDTARKLLTRIRRKLGKAKGTLVTVYEFCDHTGFRPEWVFPFLT